MSKGDPNPTGEMGWYVDSDGNGHNVPIQVDQYGNVKQASNFSLISSSDISLD